MKYGGTNVDLVLFQERLNQFGVSLSEEQKNQFQEYAQFLVEYNEKVNLTTITELEEIYEKHFYDSLLIGPFVKGQQSLCDVGSGAGFPGIPLKIIYPEIQLTIIEPLKKRVLFQKLLCERLGIDVNIVNQRAEDASEYRETFDVVTARAVANLNILAELCIPLVKKEGIFIAMKGSKGREELEQAKKATKELGCELEEVQENELSNNEKRMNIVYRKKRGTSAAFPRKYAAIKKKPL